MNNFDSFQFGASKSDTCGKCGMHTTDSNGCCNDELKIVKIDDDQQVAGMSFKFVAPEIVIPAVSNFNEELIEISFKSSSFNNHSPPLNRQDTYLQNCVFRI